MGCQVFLVLVLALSFISDSHSAGITFRNNCPFPIWPATATAYGATPKTGFELEPQATKGVGMVAPWSGRIWARFQCSKAGGLFSCNSGDCDSGSVECNGRNGKPPTTLVELKLGGAGETDFYGISLVDGFNLPVTVTPNCECSSASCPVDINRDCPDELAIKDPSGGKIGCKSACLAFGKPEYCCTGEFGRPETCKQTQYSQIFKEKCPQAFSYGFDAQTSSFTCRAGASYQITFCP